MDLEKAMSMVLDTLHCASSQNQQILTTAEKKLQEWEEEPGFYSILMSIYRNNSVDLNVRWLAILYFKNGVDKYWRKSAPNAIPEDEKIKLRQVLLESFREPINPLAVQLAVVISKVARLDCPREWPDLIPTLLTAVRDTDLLVQHRSLLTLNHVVKTLSSKRLPGDRRIFQELSGNIYSFTLALWNTHTEWFLQHFPQNPDLALPSLEKSLLALKILGKLTVFGFQKPHESEDVVTFMNLVFDRAKTMLECRKQLPAKDGLKELTEKFVVQLMKVLLLMLEAHPISFVDFIQKTLEFTVYYTFLAGAQDSQSLFNRFKLQCLYLINLIMLCVEYKQSKLSGENHGFIRGDQIKKSFFTPEILSAICQGLVGHYFLLTPEDLQTWDEDPETFAFDESGENWRYNIRPCAESLFGNIFHEYKTVLTPILLATLQSNCGTVSASDLNAILLKDAIYNAIGLAAFDLFDEINFDEWFLSTLQQELVLQGGHLRIVRRRAAWLLGRWTGVKLSPELRPVLYSALLPLLQPNEDLVVRFTASDALRTALDDYYFSVDQFLEFLEPVMVLLFNLLEQCEASDSKMHVLNVISFIVERVGEPTKPHLSNLVQYITRAWSQAVEHSMLRCAIVTTLVYIVKVMASESKVHYNFLIPILAECLDLQRDDSVYLVEDGLILWRMTILTATEMTNELMQLFQHMPSLMESGVDSLHVCVQITEAYTLLSPDSFLKVYGESILKSAQYLLTDLYIDDIGSIMNFFELCLRAAPQFSCEWLKPVIPEIMIVFCNPGKLITSYKVDGIYLCIMARVLLCSKEIFFQMLREAAHRIGKAEDEFLKDVLILWSKVLPFISNLAQRKVLGLALSSLLTIQSGVVLSGFAKIMKRLVEILNDLIVTDDSGALLDILSYGSNIPSSPPESDNVEAEFLERETEHDLRLKRLKSQDIVYTVVFKDYLVSQLEKLQALIGLDQLQQYISSLDIETATALKEYMGGHRDSHIESCFSEMKIS